MAGLAGMYDLKKEEDVKEYLNNLGIEYRYQCLHEKLPEGCHRLADFFESFERNERKAREVYTENCDQRGYGHSCFKVAAYNMTGKGGEKDRKTAYKYYIKGCDAGYVKSCHNAALMHDVGYLAPDEETRDYKKASDLLSHACEKGNAPSCNLLSTYYIAGNKHVAKDMKNAFKYALRSCELGHMYACANVSIMYKKGDGVDRNMELSKEYENKAKGLYRDATVAENTIKMGE